MANNCPACDYNLSERGTSGYCMRCGWEFITFAQPFPEGENMLKKRIETARSFIYSLREGSDQLTSARKENEQIKGLLEEAGNAMQNLKNELETMRQRNRELELQLEKAIRDQSFIAANARYEGRYTRIEFGVNGNGEIAISCQESLSSVPNMMMVVKKGDIPVGSPEFGEDGTYAAILQSKRWRPASDRTFYFSSEHFKQIFPKMEGIYTFSLIAFSPEYKMVRMGGGNDLSSVTLNFSN